MAKAETIIVGGGISAGNPFTVGAVPFISVATPPTIQATGIEWFTLGTGGLTPAIFIGTTDPQPAATETLRTSTGIISEKAGSPDSVILGRGIGAVANGGVAIGQGAAAGGGNGVAIGQLASAPATGGVAIGPSAVASGNNNTAIGGAATTNAAGSATAIGQGAGASQNGVSVGQNAQGTGIGAIAIGKDATASITSSIAIGGGASTNGFKAIVMAGFNALARDDYQIILHSGDSPMTTSAGATTGSIVLSGNGASLTHDANILIGVGLASFQANTAMIGGPGTIINTLVLGRGATNATTPTTFILRVTDRTGAGANAGTDLQIRSGAGTGVNLGQGNIDLRTPVAAGAGVTQSFATRLRCLAGGGVTLFLPDVTGPTLSVGGFGGAGIASVDFTNMTNGAAAAAGTLLNSPVAGNPTFWMPVKVNGVAKFVPLW